MKLEALLASGKIKRYFSARNKISYAGSVSHITQRAPGREQVFIEQADYEYMTSLLKEAARDSWFTIHSYVLMPNHVHLLIRLLDIPLSQVMRDLFRTYAQHFNHRYERKGHVFSGRYRQALCLDNSYLLASSAYIHLNPVVAGLVRNVDQYRWSSISCFRRRPSRDCFVDSPSVLSVIDADLTDARRHYSSLLDHLAARKIQLLREHGSSLRTLVDQLRPQLHLLVSPRGPDDRQDRLLGRLRSRKYSKSSEVTAARRYLVQQLRAQGYSMPEIGSRLDLTKQAVWKILNQ